MGFDNVPVGIDDFKKMRDRGVYYVDKTRFVEKVLSNTGVDVFLFTRPRRFG